MVIIPAIDIRGGNVVRLIRGDYNQETTYAFNPVEIAEKWVSQGAEMLHIVDLDGAREGFSVNIDSIKKIVETFSVPIQVGGGIRSLLTAKTMLETGVTRVIIGTKALDNELLNELIKEFGSDKIVVGIDAASGIVKTDGWIKNSGVQVEYLCEMIVRSGVRHIVFTDIACDGMMKGPNLKSLSAVLAFKELSVVASGGVSSLDDVTNICNLTYSNIFGIIIGKALYEGTIDIASANAIVHSTKEKNR
jgi:phosphoribosylformimino-5-aminoimidazole carboxamide ribotide isomerase